MAAAYAAADLVVARAGAMTIAEIAAAGRPALLVPFAAATHAHQEANARALESKGAAVVLTEAEATDETLAAALAASWATRCASSRWARRRAARLFRTRLRGCAICCSRWRRHEFPEGQAPPLRGDRRHRDERPRRAPEERRARGDRVGSRDLRDDPAPEEPRHPGAPGPPGREHDRRGRRHLFERGQRGKPGGRRRAGRRAFPSSSGPRCSRRSCA